MWCAAPLPAGVERGIEPRRGQSTSMRFATGPSHSPQAQI
jgi:hypothetical protein